MGVKNHSDTTPGNLHSGANLAYPTSADRIAGTNEESGIVLAAKYVGQFAWQKDTDTLWFLLSYDPIVWKEVLTA